MQGDPNEYARRFCDPAEATSYESFYKPGSADEAMWTIEQEFLANFVERNCSKWATCDYLDFACGTGRVLAFMEDRVGTARGIDISPEMLEVARGKVHKSELSCLNITSEPSPVATYDLITAFRFFLNAEAPVRAAVMRALAVRLRNSESRLIFNNHGNPLSYKAVTWPLHRIRQAVKGRPVVGNYLTHREVEHLVADAGLEILERTGVGLVSPRLFKLRPSLARSVEWRTRKSAVARLFGVNQIYVVRRRRQ